MFTRVGDFNQFAEGETQASIFVGRNMALHIEIRKRPFRATVHEWEDIASQLEALELSFQIDRATGTKRGVVVYGTPSDHPVVTLAWQWLEVAADVLAIDDPMNISSNLVLVDEDGHELPSQKRILHLNNALFCLPWQPPVLARAKTRRRPASCASRLQLAGR